MWRRRLRAAAALASVLATAAWLVAGIAAARGTGRLTVLGAAESHSHLHDFGSGLVFGDRQVFHPGAVFGEGNTFGELTHFKRGAHFAAGSHFAPGTSFGRGARFGPDTSFARRTTIERGATVGAGATFGEGAIVGPDAVFGPGVQLAARSYVAGDAVFTGGDRFGPGISFGRGVRFGPNTEFDGDELFSAGDSFGDNTKFDAADAGKDSFTGQHSFGVHNDWGANVPRGGEAKAGAGGDAGAPPSGHAAVALGLPPGYKETAVPGVYEFSAPDVSATRGTGQKGVEQQVPGSGGPAHAKHVADVQSSGDIKWEHTGPTPPISSRFASIGLAAQAVAAAAAAGAKDGAAAAAAAAAAAHGGAGALEEGRSGEESAHVAGARRARFLQTRAHRRGDESAAAGARRSASMGGMGAARGGKVHGQGPLGKNSARDTSGALAAVVAAARQVRGAQARARRGRGHAIRNAVGSGASGGGRVPWDVGGKGGAMVLDGMADREVPVAKVSTKDKHVSFFGLFG